MKDTAKNDDLLEKLNFLGLDVENIPEFLKDFSPLGFNTSRFNNDKDHKVYRFVPVDKIEVLITPCLRGDDMKQKYTEAVPLGRFFNPSGDEDDIERYTTLLRIINSLSVTEMENMATLQATMAKSEPFKVKFAKDNMWQIYYSVSTDKYFMLVCSKEETFTEFLYLLKKKIEFGTDKKEKVAPCVYVPINYLNYSEQYLNRDEIANIENFLWLFTKNWPLIYEVYDPKGNMSLQVVGDTYVYGNVKSTYKIKVENKEDALKLYKLLKALFILQTEIKNHYVFQTKIDSKNGLELYWQDKRVVYENLEEFIEDEYKIAKDRIIAQDAECSKQEDKLEKLKNKAQKKEEEYLEKQKEISTYLEYKKTFLGKVKYFFKSGKKKKDESEPEKEKESKPKKEKLAATVQLEDKKFYTIEDLVTVFNIEEKDEKRLKDLNQDIKAQELKLENLTSKVKNAELYIEEIDKHKKSIFEFWKFANKDEKLSLEMGNETEKKSNDQIVLKKSFDLEMDFEELGVNVDKMQRVKLSKEETDSVFIASTEVLPILNMLKNNNMDQEAIQAELEKIKEEFNKNRLYIDSEIYDIFGNVDNDSTKIRYIGSRSHRENEKSKFRILNINKKIDVFDFTEKLISINSFIEGAIPKITSKYDMPLYQVKPITEKINENNFEVFDINIENALTNFEDSGEGALNLIKINFKENMPLLYFSNIIYYDNTNMTLPEGMNLSSSVLIDCSRFEFKQVGESRFRTNNYFTEQNNLIMPKSKDILVYEYDVELKKPEKPEKSQKAEKAEEKDLGNEEKENESEETKTDVTNEETSKKGKKKRGKNDK